MSDGNGSETIESIPEHQEQQETKKHPFFDIPHNHRDNFIHCYEKYINLRKAEYEIEKKHLEIRNAKITEDLRQKNASIEYRNTMYQYSLAEHQENIEYAEKMNQISNIQIEISRAHVRLCGVQITQDRIQLENDLKRKHEKMEFAKNIADHEISLTNKHIELQQEREGQDLDQTQVRIYFCTPNLSEASVISKNTVLKKTVCRKRCVFQLPSRLKHLLYQRTHLQYQ